MPCSRPRVKPDVGSCSRQVAAFGSGITRQTKPSSEIAPRRRGNSLWRRSVPPGTTAMTPSADPAAHPLRDFSGTILLVGAGRMGGALLEGWLALGLAARSIAVIEPEPAVELETLARRGRTPQSSCRFDRTGRGGGARGEAADRGRGDADARRFRRSLHGRGFHHGRPHAAVSRSCVPATLLLCVPCRTRPPRSGAASRSQFQTPASRHRNASLCMRCFPPSGRSNGSLTRRSWTALPHSPARGPLMYSCSQRPWQRPELRPACRRHWPSPSRAPRSRARASFSTVRHSTSQR